MTGSRGPISKPDGRRQRRNKTTSALVLGPPGGKKLKMPSAPKDYLSVTVEKWKTFWRSDLAKTMREEQLPMIVRLHDRYDERERAFRVVRADGRLTIGSAGQLVLHPLLKQIDSCESAILQLEDRIGISPRRGGNGASGGGTDQTLDEVNRRLNGDEEPDARDEDETDPREKHVVGEIRGS
jgi:hypothetical protein